MESLDFCWNLKCFQNSNFVTKNLGRVSSVVGQERRRWGGGFVGSKFPTSGIMFL